MIDSSPLLDDEPVLAFGPFNLLKLIKVTKLITQF